MGIITEDGRIQVKAFQKRALEIKTKIKKSIKII